MFTGNLKLKQIFLLGFLLSLQMAFTYYINSSFLTIFSGEKSVGMIYAVASACSILLLFFVPQLLNKMGAYKFLLWTSGLNAFMLLLLSILKSSFTVIPVFIFYFTLNVLMIFALDELLQIFSANSTTGRVRGLYIALISMAWVISQTVSGRTLNNTSFSTVYIVGFTIMSAFFLTVLLSLENLIDPAYDKVVGKESFKKFFANKNLRRAYKLNFLLQFFYASMVIYTPIYLYAHLGFDWKQIGIMFTFMLLPFVIIPYPLGKHSDKFGERKMLMLGFAISAVATIFLFFISWHTVWIWALALFITRIGAATIEAMNDVYFFKHITRENDEFISVYRNAVPVSYILAPMLGGLVLLLAPSLEYLFLLLGATQIYGIYLASTIRKSDI